MLNAIQFQGVIFLLLAGAFCFALAIYFNNKSPSKGFKFLCGVFLFMLFFQYCDEMDLVFLPKQNIHTFEELKESMDWPIELYKIQNNQEEFVEAVVAPGKIASLLRLSSFRSGMPAYIFSMDGRLIDSTKDNLDDPRFQDKWNKPGKTPRQEISDTIFVK